MSGILLAVGFIAFVLGVTSLMVFAFWQCLPVD